MLIFMNSISFIVYVVAIAFFCIQVQCNSSGSAQQNNQVFAFKSLTNCKNNEYYDVDYFNCILCDTTLNLVPSNDRRSCICNPKATVEVLYDASFRRPVCGENCKNCTTTSTQPEKCNLKFISQAWNGTAQKPAQIHKDEDGTCLCNLKTNSLFKNYCIPNILLKDFLGYGSFRPHHTYDDLKFSAFFCKVLKNATACNHLANLCVASFFSVDKNSPCSLFLVSQASDTSTYGGEGLDDVRPFLFFRKGRAIMQEFDKTIDYSYRLVHSQSATVEQENVLKLVTTSYTLDGKLHNIVQISPHNINFCTKNIIPEYDKFIFGQNFRASCKISLEGLIDFVEHFENKLFHSIFINYTIDNTKYLQPVPILIENAFTNNQDNNKEDWQFVKRFSLFDAQQFNKQDGGAPIVNEEEPRNKLKQFKWIRFIDKFRIYCSIKDENKIAVPLIMVRYKQINIARNESLRHGYDYEFEVVFSKKHSFDFYFEILLPFFIALGFAFALLRTFNYKTRQNKEYYDFAALLQFTLYLFSYCANAFLIVASVLCFYVFIIHNNQTTVRLLLPINEEGTIEVLLYLACILKSIYLGFYFWKMSQIDIFFIDWEKPKGFDLHVTTARSNLDTPSVCSSSRSYTNESVSAWRNYFVANEWIKISTKRKTSIFLQNIVVLAIMRLIANESPEQFGDKTLLLALAITVYVSVYIVQHIIVYLISNRIFGNPLQQFVDICSTANTSVFVLLQNSYGFYIHGRSPHGFSDTDMSSMIIQLQREAQNMCGKRGLLTGSDQQTYTILAPTNLRMYYKKLLMPLQTAANISSQLHHFEEEFINHKTYEQSQEKTTSAYNSVNRFFCAFIDHGIKDLDYVIKERTIIEMILNCEFDNYLSESKGTFYIDNGHSFGRVLLYGNDIQHFLFEIVLFSCIVITTESLVLSASVLCLLYKVFQLIFRNVVKNNIAAKTLIDKRFLL